jgi:hypothetical protein
MEELTEVEQFVAEMQKRVLNQRFLRKAQKLHEQGKLPVKFRNGVAYCIHPKYGKLQRKTI